MRVFVAGASGAIGTRLVPQLVDLGWVPRYPSWREGVAAAYASTSDPEPDPVGGRKP